MRRRSRGSVLLGSLAIAACARDRTLTSDSAIVAPSATAVAVTPPDSASLQAATKALGEFLDASREGSPNRASLARLTSCPDGGGPTQGPMLAAFDLLPASWRADTVVGRAIVTTVAEQDVDRQHPGYFIARVRVRRDTLEWDVLRSEANEWIVCNGLQFGLTAPDSLTQWRPKGASAAAARALVDSIAAATRP